MLHPDVEHPILLSMAEDRISKNGPVQGLRQPSHTGSSWRQMVEMSGDLLIKLGRWLKAQGGEPVLAEAGTLSPTIVKAGIR